MWKFEDELHFYGGRSGATNNSQRAILSDLELLSFAPRCVRKHQTWNSFFVEAGLHFDLFNGDTVSTLNWEFTQF